jgi:hypothetical protein
MPEFPPISETPTTQRFRAEIRSGIADHKSHFVYLELTEYDLRCLDCVIREIENEGWHTARTMKEETGFRVRVYDLYIFKDLRSKEDWEHREFLRKSKQDRTALINFYFWLSVGILVTVFVAGSVFSYYN